MHIVHITEQTKYIYQTGLIDNNLIGYNKMRVKKIRRHRDNEQTQFGNPVAKHSWKINRAKRFADKTKYDRKRKAPIQYDLRSD